MKTIAIVAGGNSSEFEISVKSAKNVCNALQSRYITYIISIKGSKWYWEDNNGHYYNIDKNDFSLVHKGSSGIFHPKKAEALSYKLQSQYCPST